MEDSDFTLIVDRANAFQFRVDDIETQQSHVNWQSLASDRAAYALSQAFDKDVLGYLSGYELVNNVWTARTTPVGTKAWDDADGDELFAAHKLVRGSFISGGTATDSIPLTPTPSATTVTGLQLLNRINRLMDQINVPNDNRWVVVDPVFAEILMDEDSKLVNNDYNIGDGEGLNNGMLSANKIRGFRVYMSNNLPYLGTGPGTVAADGSASNLGVIVAGHDSAVATAEQINKTESFRDPNSFGDIVRGMHMYGRKILRSEGLVRAHYNVA